MARWGYALAAVAVVGVLTGCSAVKPAEKPASPGAKSSTEAKKPAATTTEPEKKAEGPVKLAAETDGEKAALALVGSDFSRKFAMGNSEGSMGTAQGDAFLTGYVVTLNDGKKQYQVVVMDGKVVGYFGKSGYTYVEGAFAPENNPTIAPQSKRQEDAVAAAKASLASVNAAATSGGIELYHFNFPMQDVGGVKTYPSISMYADAKVGDSPAMGGAEMR
jgi:hypothetical protein